MSEKENYDRFRATTPSASQKYISRYDVEGPELQDLQQTGKDLVDVFVLNLGTAAPASSPFLVPTYGRAIALYGFLTANQYDPATNLGTEPPEASAFVVARLNTDKVNTNSSLNNLVVLKHGRGYHGSFGRLALTWPAQTGVSARLYVYRYDRHPYEKDGDLRFQGRQDGSVIATAAVVSVLAANAVQIVGVSQARKVTTITNLGSTNVFLGDSGVTIESGANPGTLLLPNGIAFWRNTAALFGISKTSNNNVSVNNET